MLEADQRREPLNINREVYPQRGLVFTLTSPSSCIFNLTLIPHILYVYFLISTSSSALSEGERKGQNDYSLPDSLLR